MNKFLFALVLAAGLRATLVAEPIKSASELLGVEIQPGKLCEVLESIDRGQVKSVRAIGLVVHATVFDPYFGECDFDVEPEAFVELAPEGPNVSISPEFRSALAARARPILIAFSGEIHGPQVLGPDDLSLPVFIAFSRRTLGLGYGPRRNRAKLVIREVIALLKDPPNFGTDLSRTPPKKQPLVLAAGIPSYPRLAWNVNLEGDVVLEVKVAAGVLAEPRLISGDRLLAVGAIEHIQTWKVAEGSNATLEIVYRYRLEPRRKSDPFEPRITLQLPHFVEVVARRNGWN